MTNMSRGIVRMKRFLIAIIAVCMLVTFIPLNEKKRLLKLYYESDETGEVFCAKHGISKSSLYRWISKFGPDIKVDPDEPSSEEQLREENLRLKIENERLKKKYMVKKSLDGKTEYIRLKVRNTR